MAATRLIPLHINKGKTAAASIKDRIDYAEDPSKTENGNLVASYECDPRLAWQEFMLDRGRYLAAHGSERESDVIGYQIRQAFKPGEITPEEANRIGYELAMRFTKGKHAFVVSTHIDRAHVHNHILFNAVDLKAERKFRNFFLSTYAVRRLSDTICVEHGLSIIEEKPRREWQKRTTYKKELSHREILRMDLDEIMEKWPGSYDEFLLLLKRGGYEIKRGKQLSVRSKKMDRFIRFRSLGEGYSETELVRLVLLILLIFLIRYLPHGNLCTSPKRFDQFASISINADGLLFNLPRAKGFIEIKAGIGCLCIFL